MKTMCKTVAAVLVVLILVYGGCFAFATYIGASAELNGSYGPFNIQMKSERGLKPPSNEVTQTFSN